MGEVLAALIAGCIAIVTSVVGVIVSKLESKKRKIELEAIRNAIDEGGGKLYVVCPNCGNRFYLSGSKIHKEE